MTQTKRISAFTLIELLIVVAIIAILAAIAVPNFLEAQVRSKVSRCRADVRSIATGLESYRVDYNHYCPDPLFYNSTINSGGSRWPGGGTMSQAQVDDYLVLQVLTTPIAYMTAIPPNVFGNHSFNNYYVGKPAEMWYVYWGAEWKELSISNNPSVNKDKGAVWSITSTGPDRLDSFGEYLIFGEEVVNSIHVWGMDGAIYDPTNGTVSNGDVVRIGP